MNYCKHLFLFFCFSIIITSSVYGNDLLGIGGKSNISIPLFEDMIFSITGSTNGSISIKNLSPELIDVRASEVSNCIIIKGLSIGQATFILKRGNIKTPIYVSIKESAGLLPKYVRMVVTGNPASKDFLKEAALRAVMAQTKLKDNSYLLFDEYVSFNCPSYLARGENVTLDFPVKIESSVYFPVRNSVRVEISNKIISDNNTECLMISNRPEKIEGEGILFHRDFMARKPVRLLFYHQNSPNSQPREFTVKINNPSNKYGELKLISGLSGPSQDVFYVGHSSTLRFLRDYSSDSGQIITIPPGGEVTIFRALMNSGDVVSGLVEMHILSENNLTVTAIAGKPENNTDFLPDEFDPFKINPKGVFLNPDISSDIYYNIGQSELSVPVGVSPWLCDIETGAPNQGNYGVIYKFNLILGNMTGDKKSVKVYFSPVNGAARGIFVIDGILYESGLIKPGHSSCVCELPLNPKERKMIKIFTTPQSASCYPVNLIFKTGL